MNRKEIIYNKLLELKDGAGSDTKTISSILNMSRANVSHELNILCKEGKVIKTTSRPVKFSVSNTKAKTSELHELVKNNISLRHQIEQLKAAVLYPPKGMNCLILGNTGVGKSMFASLIHSYAVEMGVKSPKSPFIIFNCADYTNNPQLLTSQLFGVKKGTYTGADCDKVGLIEKANGGILFLDEVHRLPPEGQEALFIFLDTGSFRRMGDDVLRKSDVLVIGATTEDPKSALLKTFTRRIPMCITLPSLKERTLEERLYLIKSFFKNESKKLNREIYVSLNTIRAFLSYDCPNNIGQLKSDVQLVCAKAYSEFLTNIKTDVRVNSRSIPSYIHEGLYKEKENRIVWTQLVSEDIEYFKFSGNEISNEDISIKNNSIYEIIENKLEKLKTKGISDIDIENILEKDITKYFQNYINGVSENINRKNLVNIIGEEVLDFVDSVIYKVVSALQRNISNNIYTAMALHINTLITRVYNNKEIINPQLSKIKVLYPKEYKIALMAKKAIEEYVQKPIPEDEAGYLTLFLLDEDTKSQKCIDKVNVVVIAHGKTTATSMAEVANTLLGEDFVIGINAPLEVKPSIVLKELKEVIKHNFSTKGYVFLVDMGSLITFGEVIENEFKVPVKVFPLVSTIHVIEAARKSLLGFSINEIYHNVKSINFCDYSKKTLEEKSNVKNKVAIITACLTGQGSSLAVKSFLSSNLNYDSNIFDIISLNCVDTKFFKEQLRKIQMEKEILFIILSFPIDTKLKQYNMYDVISMKVLPELQNMVDTKTVILKMPSVFRENILNLDSDELYEDINEFIKRTEYKLNAKLSDKMLIALSLHMAFVFSRLKDGKTTAEYPKKSEYIKENPGLYKIIKENLVYIYNKYFIVISDSEICYMMKFFLNDD
ncbi:MAG: sigma 54-interacting transcriptional regulator [Clostridium sp.]|nr:sigma 54-interacting transcriptional regulator [Clostridium sp.]